MNWYDGLTFRGLKSITTKGDLFRRCLNSYRSKTKNTLMVRDIAIKADISPQRMTQFVNGQWEAIPEENLIKVVEQILPYKEFKKYMTKTAIPIHGIFAPSSTRDVSSQPKKVPVKESSKEEEEATPKSAFLTKKSPKQGNLGITIHSNLLDGFLAVVSVNCRSLILYENTPAVVAKLKKLKKKWVYIAPADQIGEDIIQRSTSV